MNPSVNEISRDSAFVLPWGFRGRGLPVPHTAAVLVILLVFGLYLYTLAPNVTLEDSGEYITAAATLGVTHPPGYPLWTTISHLFVKFLPYGNIAWRVNLVSAVFGALACGIVAWLTAHSTRWLLDDGERDAGLPRWLLPFLAGVTAGLCLGCSEVMWSQSVIVEVYTLNAVFVTGAFTLFYRWARRPQATGRLLATAVLFALGLSNHHTLLFTLPIFLVGVLLVRIDYFPTFFSGVLLLSVSALGMLTWFSGDPVLETVTQRFAFVLLLVVLGFAAFNIRGLRWRRFFGWALVGAVIDRLAVHSIGGWFAIGTVNGWLLVLLIPLVLGAIGLSTLDRRFLVRLLVLSWICLSVYGLEKIYSGTNPPMNWSYARDNGGFFHSVSRGQYVNSLTNLLLGRCGPWLGVPAPTPPPAPEPIPLGIPSVLVQSVTSYFNGLEDNFTLPLCLIAFLGFFLFGHLARERRRWLYFLAIAFLFLSFLMAAIDPKDVDRLTWQILRRFFLPAHCVFALGLGYGVAGGLLALRRHAPQVRPAAYGLVVLLAALPFATNLATSNQRGHWFGWQYGTNMLRPLEKGAVFYGGTDPGRFVPTYMVFCESTQPARWKRDPSFDRSDLYVITQNALADYYYLRYLTDQYDIHRRQTVFSDFEKTLGRDHAYPKEGIDMPDQEEFQAIYDRVSKESSPDGGVYALNGELSKAIFDKNKARHAFYVEESFAIPWMYPHLVPSGLILKINPEPLASLPPEAVAKDRAFWDAYTARLLATPGFADDEDAQASFGKLRNSIANVYAYRHLNDEAIYAYRQALTLAPHNSETILTLAHFYTTLEKTEEAEKLVSDALRNDPNNRSFASFLVQLRVGRQADAQAAQLRTRIVTNPDDADAYRQLIAILLGRQKGAEAMQVLDVLAARFPLPPEELAQYVQGLLQAKNPAAAQGLVERQLHFHPKETPLLYTLASLHAFQGHRAEAFRALATVLAADPATIHTALAADPAWNAYRADPEFQRMATSSPAKTSVPAPKK
jgi:tetratricopeptide (TPR) repeat protein